MSATVSIDVLSKLPLFEGLSAESLDRLAELLHHRTVPAGTQLASAHQRGDKVFVILEGSVKVQHYTSEGAEVTLALLGPGNTLGEMGLVGPTGHSADVVTRETTTLVWMERKTFKECLESIPGLSQNLITQLIVRLRSANERIEALSILDVTGRVARQIHTLAEEYGEPVEEGVRITLPLTQSDIAEMVAATRERVNHVMVRLKKDGVVSVAGRRQLTIHRPDELAKLFAG
ncbi:MAG TPA: Crp/Fnr family transcriptional regulator [Thermoanaerobaculia bacterium]|nr:Crp/Fnr family transcriptional regulator [Thermoanaerobaculia bacterium]